MNEYDYKRIEYNKKLLSKLAEAVGKNPTQRFGQILRNNFYPELDDQTVFYEEPWDTHQRVQEMEPSDEI